jgi:hypothetical protein
LFRVGKVKGLSDFLRILSDCILPDILPRDPDLSFNFLNIPLELLLQADALLILVVTMNAISTALACREC